MDSSLKLQWASRYPSLLFLCFKLQRYFVVDQIYCTVCYLSMRKLLFIVEMWLWLIPDTAKFKWMCVKCPKMLLFLLSCMKQYSDNFYFIFSAFINTVKWNVMKRIVNIRGVDKKYIFLVNKKKAFVTVKALKSYYGQQMFYIQKSFYQSRKFFKNKKFKKSKNMISSHFRPSTVATMLQNWIHSNINNNNKKSYQRKKMRGTQTYTKKSEKINFKAE